jgi:hypothetical protein
MPTVACPECGADANPTTNPEGALIDMTQQALVEVLGVPEEQARALAEEAAREASARPVGPLCDNPLCPRFPQPHPRWLDCPPDYTDDS